MKYRCLIETFVDVDEESEEEAQIAVVEKLCSELREDPRQIIVWEDTDKDAA